MKITLTYEEAEALLFAMDIDFDTLTFINLCADGIPISFLLTSANLCDAPSLLTYT